MDMKVFIKLVVVISTHIIGNNMKQRYMAHSSLTQTTVLKGVFKSDAGVKKEFFDNIKLQQEFAPK